MNNFLGQNSKFSEVIEYKCSLFTHPVVFRWFSVASMRLAYKELEIDRKREEKRLQNLEGKKREQAERLGMGLGTRR